MPANKSTKKNNGDPKFSLLREYRRGAGPTLDLDPRIDLTKPIWEQAQRLMAKDRKRRVRKSKAA